MRAEQVTGVEHRGDQGDVGVAGRQVLVGGGEPVEPRRVDLAGADLRTVEEVEEERLVRRATADDDTVICASARCSRARASSRSRPWAMTLAIIESYSGGITSPSATPVSTRMPGPDGQRQRLDGAWRRGERPLRVLGVEPGLDGVALRRRRLALEPPAGGDVELQLDEVESRRQFGDRVLDLEAGVDLEEGERLLGGLVEELDRPGVVIPGRRPPGGRPRPAGRDPVRPSGRCSATPRSPSGCAAACCSRGRPTAHAVPWVSAISCTSTWRGSGDDALHEHRRVTERLEPLGAGALEGLGQAGRVVDPADAPTAATRRRLDHQRVADGLGVTPSGVEIVDRTAAPRGDRHIGLLGQQLGADLVARGDA